jgi:NADH dehydrogenase [ubiquinone] 1 alpha subcomplex assembly factor 6
LQLQALGVSDVKADHLASHIGKASGIITLLRGTPFHVQNRQFYLPSEIMAKVCLGSDIFPSDENFNQYISIVFNFSRRSFPWRSIGQIIGRGF